MRYQGQKLINGRTYCHVNDKSECEIIRVVYCNEGVFGDITENSPILAIQAVFTKHGGVNYAHNEFWMGPHDFSLYWKKKKEPTIKVVDQQITEEDEFKFLHFHKVYFEITPEQEERYLHLFNKLYHKMS